MRTLFQDTRYALRQLRKSPVFTLTAVLTLALGIGANTAVFTLVHEVMLKSLPVTDPAGLYHVGDTAECCIEGGFQDDWVLFAYPLYQYLQKNTPEFTEMLAAGSIHPDVAVRRAGGNVPDNLAAEMVSGNYFSVLGVTAGAGRLITPDDDREGAPIAAVMSYRVWQEKYGMDRSLIGSHIMISGIPATLVGIAAPGFDGERRRSSPTDLWVPLFIEPQLDRENTMLRSPTTNWLYVLGRLRPGTRLDQLSTHMTAELQQYLLEPGNMQPEQNRANLNKQHIRVTRGFDGINSIREEYEQGLYLLLAASAVILLIACANVANLLLARGTVTRFRTSLQLAIGAPRARIIRAGLTESVILAILGAAAGLILAYFASRAMVLLAFRGARVMPVSPSPSLPVLGFTFLVSLVTGIIFGVGPAWMASRSDPAQALHGAGRSTRDRSTLPQKVLVILQAALSLVLLALAGLLTQSLRNLKNQEYGFQRTGRILVSLDPRNAGYTPDRLAGLYQQIEDRFKHMPGVINESLSLYTAQQGNNWGEGIHILGRPRLDNNGASWDRVSAHYFETIGTRVVRGRSFAESDTASSEHVAVVNEAFVKKFLPDVEPLGQHFGKGDSSHAGDYAIAGVVKDAKYQDASRPARAMFFIPLAQTIMYQHEDDARVESASMYMDTIELHVAGDPNSFQPQIRQTLTAIDPSLAAPEIRTFDELIERQTRDKNMVSRLSALFGLVSLLLASIGLYGLTAYQVARRTSEIGIRMALGADRWNILKMVLRGAFLQVLIGLAIGIPIALVTGKLFASQLYGITSFNPVVLALAIAALGTCALVASIFPARRAAGIDPMRALRIE